MKSASLDSESILDIKHDEDIPISQLPPICAHCLLDRGRLEDQRHPAEEVIVITRREPHVQILLAELCHIHARIVCDIFEHEKTDGYFLETFRKVLEPFGKK